MSTNPRSEPGFQLTASWATGTPPPWQRPENLNVPGLSGWTASRAENTLLIWPLVPWRAENTPHVVNTQLRGKTSRARAVRTHFLQKVTWESQSCTSSCGRRERPSELTLKPENYHLPYWLLLLLFLKNAWNYCVRKFKILLRILYRIFLISGSFFLLI